MKHPLSTHGITESAGTTLHNPCAAVLVEEAVKRGEGQLVATGPFCAVTSPYTGRSPNDKFVVDEPHAHDKVDWGKVNQPIAEAHFENLRSKVVQHLSKVDRFVIDCFVGADPRYRIPLRVVTEKAWVAHFVCNMFILPTAEELAAHTPEFTVLHAPSVQGDPSTDGTNSEAFVVLNFGKGEAVIGGTGYAGEVKKSMFSVMNYYMPLREVFPMHCSANMADDGHTAIFFGLSGTGKTTLSADPTRTLIGDDEHGWSDHGVFNFEGGCYAKVIRLSAAGEPEIYATTQMFGTILENVVYDPITRVPDYNDGSKTENTRSAYPLEFIPNASRSGRAGHPKNIILLTADAFGVMPPIAKLTPTQAMYHFLSGYTAKVAGTEKGLVGVQPEFSTCFGAPFLPRHPSVYADLLRDYINKYNVDCWLVNSGWTGGKYGEGRRMPIKATRTLLSAALDGSLKNADFRTDPYFGFSVPTSVPGVEPHLLNPFKTWKDKAAFDRTARDLVGMFQKNFAKYESHVTPDVKAAAPEVRIAAE